MKTKKTYDIFISHSSKDKDFCDILFGLLDKAGFNVWYDENSLLPNSHLTADLPEYIRQCESLIVILSQDSCKSSWVKDEYSFAKDLMHKNELTIIPIVIDDCELPGFYNNYKWIDCKDGLTPYAFFMILSSMYGSSENSREERDIYVSYSWRKEEQTLNNIVFNRLQKYQNRIIGDASSQSVYDENERVSKIMNTCGGFVGIVPFREETNTSKYVLDEIQKAEECGLPGIVIADSRVESLEEYTSYPIMRVESPLNVNENELKAFIQSLKIKRPKTPHVFFATNLDKQRKGINQLTRNLAGCVTATPCILGEDINDGNLQFQIIERIRNAYVMIADITGDGHCNNCDIIGTESKDKTYRFNTCIEAGIARGANTDLFIVAKEPRHSPPFMFRDINVRYYADDCDLLAIIHKILRPYRRSVLKSVIQ